MGPEEAGRGIRDQVPMSELSAFGHSRGSAGVEQAGCVLLTYVDRLGRGRRPTQQ